MNLLSENVLFLIINMCLDVQKNRLINNETVLLSINSICFGWKIRKKYLIWRHLCISLTEMKQCFCLQWKGYSCVWQKRYINYSRSKSISNSSTIVSIKLHFPISVWNEVKICYHIPILIGPLLNNDVFPNQHLKKTKKNFTLVQNFNTLTVTESPLLQ